MNNLIKIDEYPVKNVLGELLQDKTTGENIIFATDNYSNYGCTDSDYITINKLLDFGSADIQPRVMKARTEQTKRTRNKAEVFTPVHIVRYMCDHCDSTWNQQKNADDWKKYINRKVLEITCGEAPFLATRYDAATGEFLPVGKRTGILDRKLRRINEQITDETEWLRWVFQAYKSTYGYEFQGDNLLIARINLLVTFCEYMEVRWNRKATNNELNKLANIIAWNIWQMDGLNDIVPVKHHSHDKAVKECIICDWATENQDKIRFSELKTDNAKMRFQLVIGNPPYQEERHGTSTTALPVYHLFMENAYLVGDFVELITPARFLFNAGRTPKSWNKKMLSDDHLSVLMYENNAGNIFPYTEIKGGVAITYRDETAVGKPIGTFSVYPEINSILEKIPRNNCMDSMGFVATKFNTKNLFTEYPSYKGHERRMSSNVLSFDCFHDKKASNDIFIYGVTGGKRTGRYISKSLVDTADFHLDKYKVIMPKADGAGRFGDILTMPEILKKNSGFTHTFLGMGAFDTEREAQALLKYIKTKFARALLSVLKVTQDMNSEKWKLVPVQDFTANSDINWNLSISEIDQQLYKKYNLSQKEKDFIEAHVKNMD